MASFSQYWVFSRYENFLIPFLLCWVLGITVAYAIPAFPVFEAVQTVSLILLLIGLLVWAPERAIIRISLCLIAFLLGGNYYHFFSFKPSSDDISRFASRYGVSVQGILLTSLQPDSSSDQKSVLAVQSINHERTSGQIYFKLPVSLSSVNSPSLPEIGSFIEVSGNLILPKPAYFPGGFDQQKMLYSRKISALLVRVREIKVLNPAPQNGWLGFLRALNSLQWRINQVFHSSLGSPEAEVLGSIVLGDQAIPVDETTKLAFIHSGLIHMLAASGMNVAIAAGCILWLPFLKRFRKLRLALAVLTIIIYAFLAGLCPSVLRATVMLIAALLLKGLDRTLSPLFLLCLATALILAVNPDTVANIGFQFSVLTTFGIIVMVPPLQRWLGYYITHWLSGLILLPLIAEIWIIPLSLFYFNQLPVHALLLNILAVPLAIPLTNLGFAAAAFSLVYAPLGKWLSLIAWPFLKLLLGLTWLGEHWRWAQWTLPSPTGILLLGIYLFLGIAVLFCLPGDMLPSWMNCRSRKLAVLGILLSALIGGQFLQLQQQAGRSSYQGIPLSDRRMAWVIQSGDQTLIAMPLKCSRFEGFNLMAYLRRQGIETVNTLLLYSMSGQRRLSHLQDVQDMLQTIPVKRCFKLNPDQNRSVQDQPMPVRFVYTSPVHSFHFEPFLVTADEDMLKIRTGVGVPGCLLIRFKQQPEDDNGERGALLRGSCPALFRPAAAHQLPMLQLENQAHALTLSMEQYHRLDVEAGSQQLQVY